jgi:hypothetical protein
VPVALSIDLLRRVEESRARVDAMTVDECLGTAALLRAGVARLETDRQRELAQELATEFEERAAQLSASFGNSPHSSS